MAKISAHDIFRDVKNEIFNLKTRGELSVPVVMNDYTVPTEDDLLKAFWQSEDEITVKFKGKTRLIPCPITAEDNDYIARCIMQGFAQICLNRNESFDKLFTRNDAVDIMENAISRLVKEDIMEVEGDDGVEPENETHLITDNNNIILTVLYELCGNCPHYSNCEIDKYDAVVDFGDLYIIVSMDDNGYIYVNKVEGSVLDNKQEATELWKEVGECVNKINSFSHKLSEISMSGKSSRFESKIREGIEDFRNNQNYSHFAVNKDTKKIVNGWDYHDEDPEDLRQFKHDYFTVDLIDNDFDPKQYRIYTDKYLRRNGIDPDDNNNWANA